MLTDLPTPHTYEQVVHDVRNMAFEEAEAATIVMEFCMRTSRVVMFTMTAIGVVSGLVIGFLLGGSL